MNNIYTPSTFEELKSVNMQEIKGIRWAESMYTTLSEGLQKTFLNWVLIVTTLSKNEEDVIEWRDSFIRHFEESCCEMVADIQNLHEQVIANIEENLDKTQKLCKALQLEMPPLGQQKLGLYQENFHLKKMIKELEQSFKARQEEINELCSKEKKLCKSLGKETKTIRENPLLSQDEISEYKKHIESLEQEIFNREEEFYNIKEKLAELIAELKYVACDAFERDVMHQNESRFMVTDSNMKSLRHFQKTLQQKFENMKEEISHLRNKIEHLWTLLDLEFFDREQFRNRHTGISVETLEALRSEKMRCDDLKKANIQIFVEKLRQELVDTWERCHCTESVKNEFRYFFSNCYNEDLLELHELELTKWKTYAEDNKDILNLLKKHKILWSKMIELEQPANATERFNNRGGKLLTEEKERNQLSKQIPKIENLLQDLATNFENSHGTPFLTFGETVHDYINNLHINRGTAKKLKLSARKPQKENTMTPRTIIASSSKCAVSLFPTPSNTKIRPKNDQRATPKNLHSGIKRKPLTVPKILVTASSINRSKRLSMERKKRIDKIRRISRSMESRNNSTYINFVNDLTHMVGARSTLNFLEDSEIAGRAGPSNLRKTPTKTPQKTPKSSPKNTDIKLSAVKTKTKLIF